MPRSKPLPHQSLDPWYRAIAEDPADDTKRLIYDDFLDQHGTRPLEAHRAALIRAQVEVARLPEGDPERAIYEERARKALANSRESHFIKQDLAMLPEGLSAFPSWDGLERGFIDRLTVRVSLGTEEYTPAGVMELLKEGLSRVPCQHLTIQLYNRYERNDVNPNDFMAELQANRGIFRHLKSLSFRPNRMMASAPLRGVDAQVIAACSAGWPNLEALDLYQQNIGDAGARGLCRGKWPSLKVLDAGGGSITCEGARALADSTAFPVLETIGLGWGGRSQYTNPNSVDAFLTRVGERRRGQMQQKPGVPIAYARLNRIIEIDDQSMQEYVQEHGIDLPTPEEVETARLQHMQSFASRVGRASGARRR